MGDEWEQRDRERITRLEAGQNAIEQGIQEIKTLLQNMGSAYVPRGELDERFRGEAARIERLETRMRECEIDRGALRQALHDVETRPLPKTEEPGWTKLLLALVSILGGALVTLIITLAIYYQANP